MFTNNLTRLPYVVLLACLSFGLCATKPAFALTEPQQDAAIAALQQSVATLQTTVTSQAATIKSQASTIKSQGTTIATLQTLTAPFSLTTDANRPDHKIKTELYLTGVNLHLVDGSGYTDDGTNGEIANAKLLGLGNLTIGYNTASPGGPVTQSGSHSLVLGDLNRYTSYAEVVAGFGNQATAPYTSVAGLDNVAVGYGSSILGGESNQTTGYGASIGGGRGNLATGRYSVVSGGLGCTVNGDQATVGGGYFASTNVLYGWTAGVNGAQVSTYEGNFVSP